MVKIHRPRQETRVRSLGRKDALQKEMATHSNILVRRIPWTEEPGGLLSAGHKELDTTEQPNTYTQALKIKASGSELL